MRVRVLSVLSAVLLLGADTSKGPAVPEVNKKVLAFVEAQLGKQVGDGECATLVVRALQAADVPPSSYSFRGREYVWGELVRTVTAGTNLTGPALPGDILQFRDAIFKGRTRRGTYEAGYPHHTAIVAAVKNDGKVLEILHQNVGGPDDKEGRVVQRATLRFDDLQKGGWVKIYRPQP